ncbi:GntR family transcriptional regulator [Mycobacterium sp. BMJ-28]
MTEARCEIEATVLRQAIKHGDVDRETGVVAAHHRLHRTAQLDPGDPQRIGEAWASAHATFHHALLEGCPNPRLVSIAESLRASAELYRRWSVPLGHGTWDVGAEHQAIVDAIVNRNADAAVRELVHHIGMTATQLLDGQDLEAVDSAG